MACRANEYERKTLFKRYVVALQELCAVGSPRECLDALAEQSDAVRYVRGLMRARQETLLTINDDHIVRNTRVIVEGAGTKEVNGVYTYKGLKFNAGMFTRSGVFEDKDVTFTLYKCNVMQNGFQWFISITPDGLEPGSKNDIDFYYALCKAGVELLPPASWGTLQNPALSKVPAPLVRCESPVMPEMPDSLLRLIDSDTAAIAASIDESDSDQDDLSSMLPDDLINDDRQDIDSLSDTPLGSPNNRRPRDYD